MAFMIIAANVVGAALLAAVLLASGARLRQLLRIPLSPGIRWAADLTFGAGVCAFWVLGLGLFGLLGPVPLTIGLIIQAATARWRHVHRPQLALLVAATAGLPNLIVALDPPHFYDAMVYHLGLPWQALQEGAWASHPENVFSAFPPLAQLVATPALTWGGLRVPALLHWFAWVCAAVAAGALVRRLGAGKAASLLATAATMLLPSTPLVPGFPAAEGWFLAALIPALALTVPRLSKPSALPGAMLLTGLAVAARVQGLTWAAIIAGIWLLRQRSLMPVTRALPWLVIGAAPWWVKNMVLLGDPLAPVLWNREGLDTLWRDGAALLKGGMPPLDILANLPIILSPAAPVMVPLLILAALAMAGTRSSRTAFTAALIGLLLWAATGALPRFLTPTIVLLLATVLSWRRHIVPRWLGFGVVACVLLFGAATQLRWLPLVHPLAILPLSFAEAAPLVAPNPPFAAFVEADAALPPDARILLVGDSRAFGMPRPFVVTSQHDPCVLRKLIEGMDPPGLVAQDLAHTGISHLVVNTGEMDRLSGDYPVAPYKTTRGEARWAEFLRFLGPPVLERDGVFFYEIRISR